MTRYMGAVAAFALALASAVLVAAPSVFPTGTTVYDPSKAWSGFTVLSPLGGSDAVVIDMNGNVVKKWEGYNSSAGGPIRVLPGGIVIGASGANPGHQESQQLIERDFNGKELWSFDHNQQIQTKEGEMVWSVRQHHDWQREDYPAGYYSPDARPAAQGAKTLILTHVNHVIPKINPVLTLEDDRIIEVSPDGKILWQWLVSDHIDDFHFSKEARTAIADRKPGPPRGGGARAGDAGGRGGNGARGGARARAGNGPNPRGGAAARGAAGGRGPGGPGGAGFDWFHMNAASYVGPNRWYDAGDKRFAPENVLISSREASILAIVARDGSVVWQMGPDYSATPELRAIRQVIGQHNAHIIPKGLPGAGNLMVFDNGGPSGYGPPSGMAPNGENVYARPTSRVLEIDPVNMKLVWSYTGTNFFATNISGAQRLPNGDTLITEGPDGRLFEVTTDSKIVWEYVYPVFSGRGTNSVYRSYRVPYDWIPQLPHPTEKAVTPPPASEFHVPEPKQP